MKLYHLILLLFLGLCFPVCGDSGESVFSSSGNFANFTHWSSVNGMGLAAYMGDRLYFYGPVKEIRLTIELSNENFENVDFYRFNEEQQLISYESLSGREASYSIVYNYENGILKEETFFNSAGTRNDTLSYLYSEAETTEDNAYFSIEKQALDGTKLEKITESRTDNGYQRSIINYEMNSEDITIIEFEKKPYIKNNN